MQQIERAGQGELPSKSKIGKSLVTDKHMPIPQHTDKKTPQDSLEAKAHKEAERFIPQFTRTDINKREYSPVSLQP